MLLWTMESLGRFERTLKELLTPESFRKYQQEDKEIKKYLDHLQSSNDPQSVIFLEGGILKRKIEIWLNSFNGPIIVNPFRAG